VKYYDDVKETLEWMRYFIANRKTAWYILSLAYSHLSINTSRCHLVGRLLHLTITNAILFWQHSLSFSSFSANYHLHFANSLLNPLQQVNAGNVVSQIFSSNLADLPVLIRTILQGAFQSLYNNAHKLLKYLVFFGLLEFDVFDVELQNSEEKLLAVGEGVEVAFQNFADIDVSEVFES
jgi:hypothetical protein